LPHDIREAHLLKSLDWTPSLNPAVLHPNPNGEFLLSFIFLFSLVLCLEMSEVRGTPFQGFRVLKTSARALLKICFEMSEAGYTPV